MQPDQEQPKMHDDIPELPRRGRSERNRMLRHQLFGTDQPDGGLQTFHGGNRAQQHIIYACQRGLSLGRYRRRPVLHQQQPQDRGFIPARPCQTGVPVRQPRNMPGARPLGRHTCRHIQGNRPVHPLRPVQPYDPGAQEPLSQHQLHQQHIRSGRRHDVGQHPGRRIEQDIPENSTLLGTADGGRRRG